MLLRLIFRLTNFGNFWLETTLASTVWTYLEK